MLFLDAHQAAAVAPRVAQILQEELGKDPQLDSFGNCATNTQLFRSPDLHFFRLATLAKRNLRLTGDFVCENTRLRVI